MCKVPKQLIQIPHLLFKIFNVPIVLKEKSNIITAHKMYAVIGKSLTNGKIKKAEICIQGVNKNAYLFRHHQKMFLNVHKKSNTYYIVMVSTFTFGLLYI